MDIIWPSSSLIVTDMHAAHAHASLCRLAHRLLTNYSALFTPTLSVVVMSTLIVQGGPQNGLFLCVDNSATVSRREVCDR